MRPFFHPFSPVCNIFSKINEDDILYKKISSGEYLSELYRKIITELHCENYNRFDCLYYAIYRWSFSVFRYSKDEDIDFLKDEMVYDNHNIGDVYIKFKDLLPRLDKSWRSGRSAGRSDTL